jgi:hypothetical protein
MADRSTSALRAGLIVFLALLGTACGGGGGGGSEPTTSRAPAPVVPPAPVPGPDPVPLPGTTVELSGSVGDGPITDATVTIRAADFRLLGSTRSSATGDYSFTFEVQPEDFPLRLQAAGGTDLVTAAAPDFVLVSAIASIPDSGTVNLNPFTTLQTRIAEQSPGGLNDINLTVARSVVFTAAGFGLDESVMADPRTTPVTDANAAALLRASEAAGETLRRVRDSMNAAGGSLTADQVIVALAADLVDGVIDGRGAPDSDARIAAVATVASATVMLETMTNQLTVNGAPALPAMEAALTTIRPSASQRIADVPMTDDGLGQVQTAIAAASATTDSTTLTDTLDTLLLMETEPTVILSAETMTAEATKELSASTMTVASAPDAELETVNDTSRKGRPPKPGKGNSGAAYFEASTIRSGEGESVQLWIARTRDTDTLTVDISPVGGTASGADDFELSASRMSFAPGEIRRPVGLLAVDDLEFEGDEYVEIQLAETDEGGRVRAPKTMVVELIDNDVQPDAGPINTPPQISGNPPTSVTAGQAYRFVPNASDADGDSLSFSISGQPAWATFDASSGILAGTPADSDAGSWADIRIAVTDGADTATLPAFAIEVLSTPNRAPEISGSPATGVTAGDVYQFAPKASDADGDRLTFNISNKPGWATFDFATGVFSGTPTKADIGAYSGISISVSDGQDTAALAPFSITVEAPPNQAPVITGTPSDRVTAGNEYSFRPTATDGDSDTLTFSISGKPSWASFNATSGRLRGTPAGGDVGSYDSIVISVSDGQDTDQLPAFGIQVEPAPVTNTPPVISGSPSNRVVEGESYSFTPSATDADGDPLSFSVENLPAWAGFSTQTGQLSGAPGAADVGDYPGIVISVTDGSASASLGSFDITVAAAPTPTYPAPTITSASWSGDRVALAWSYPQALPAGGFDIVINGVDTNATDRTQGTSTTVGPFDTTQRQCFRVQARYPEVNQFPESGESCVDGVAPPPPTNQAPTIGGNPAGSVTEGASYSFTPTASDPDGDALTFSISGKPAWASFNNGTGRLSGTPGASDVGVHVDIRISVSDGSASASLAPFSITVNAAADPNEAPFISGTPPASVVAGQNYSFTPSASDPDGDTLTFSISGKPAWANFNTSTGRLSGTPTEADVGQYGNVRITVSDGQLSDSLPAFAVEVVSAGTRSVTVSWTPPTQREGGTQLNGIGGYKIHWGPAADQLGNVENVANGGISSYVLEGLTQGTWHIGVTAYDNDGLESAMSTVVQANVQ